MNWLTLALASAGGKNSEVSVCLAAVVELVIMRLKALIPITFFDNNLQLQYQFTQSDNLVAGKHDSRAGQDLNYSPSNGYRLEYEVIFLNVWLSTFWLDYKILAN